MLAGEARSKRMLAVVRGEKGERALATGNVERDSLGGAWDLRAVGWYSLRGVGKRKGERRGRD